MCTKSPANRQKVGSTPRHRCGIPTSQRQNGDSPGRGCIWAHLAQAGIRPQSTARMQSGLLMADGGLPQSTDVSTIGRRDKRSPALVRPFPRRVRPSWAWEAIGQAGAADVWVVPARSCSKGRATACSEANDTGAGRSIRRAALTADARSIADAALDAIMALDACPRTIAACLPGSRPESSGGAELWHRSAQRTSTSEWTASAALLGREVV
eukprot:6575955-Prymnesium_polylepis.2